MKIAVGIDLISCYVPQYYINLSELANARNIDVNKYHVGIGQYKMAIPSASEDIITMGATAANQILKNYDRSKIGTVIFATETGVDLSKSAATYIHSLLRLSSNCRAFEIKQACYSSTAALQMACNIVRNHHQDQVLIIASDIAFYGLNTSAEPTQGAGAVAFLVKNNPRILRIDPCYGIYTQDILDFWRPNEQREAIVDGKYSAKMYLLSLEKAWNNYQLHSKRNYQDHDYFVYHAPLARLVEKAHVFLAKQHVSKNIIQLQSQIQDSLYYIREIGNTYSAALYISFISLLQSFTLNNVEVVNKRLAFYAYGSGSVAEVFSGVLQKDWQIIMQQNYRKMLIAQRKALDISQYEMIISQNQPDNISKKYLSNHSDFYLEINNKKRLYKKHI